MEKTVKRSETVRDFLSAVRLASAQRKCSDGKNSSSVAFDIEELAKLDERSPDTKYQVATDDREKKEPLTEKKVTSSRLIESIKSTCFFEGVTKKDYKKIVAGDKCYLDLEYMLEDPVDYQYQVRRFIADYDSETKKYSNSKEQKELIKKESVEKGNITTKNQFTKTLSSEKYPDYSDSAKENAFGNMIVDGHVYTLSRAKLTVKPEEGKTQKWSNVNEKAIDWAGSDTFSTIGDGYAYKTTALTKKLKSYRRYTDSMG